MAEEFYTYLHCKPDGTPFYVGKGCKSKQPRSHNFNNRTKFHKNIVEKYGKSNIQVFVFYCDSEKQAFNDEKQQILQFRNEGFKLVNLTDGGEGTCGLKPSKEKSLKVRQKLFGKKRPPEIGKKISKTKIERKWTPTEETRKNMSLAGKLRASKGIPLDTRIKLSIAAKKQWERKRLEKENG
jgi:hypothetical protein